jgi:hypothetical protein
MPYDPKTGMYKPENASVSQRVTGLISKQNPIMQQAQTRGAQAANRLGLLNTSMGVQAGESAVYDVALPIASQEASQAHQSNLQGVDVTSRERLQKADITSREGMQGKDIDNQQQIARMNITSGERAQASQLAASFEQSYAAMIAGIMNNPEIPSATRQKYMNHAGKVRDSNLALVEQMYGIKLNW